MTGRSSKQTLIAAFTIAAIGLHLVLRFGGIISFPGWSLGTRFYVRLDQLPLFAALLFGGVPLVFDLLIKLLRRKFGSDLLAGISIVTSVLLGLSSESQGEADCQYYLAGSLVVLMLSGGEALESFAVRSASSVLRALARRMPSLAHRRCRGMPTAAVGMPPLTDVSLDEGQKPGFSEKPGFSQVLDVSLDEVTVGDTLVVFPHEICPVDGTVIEGHGVMDESYLTGEPYVMSKTPGSEVLSGSINGETALTIRADKRTADSRYAKIMQVMRASELHRPRLRRLGDELGAFYTPLAVAIALAAWLVSGQAVRFLAVLVVATPCPLLIAIPVAIIGSISLAARRGIIIKDPAVLEKIDTCRTAIFDKTGTLTYGQPKLTEVLTPGVNGDTLLPSLKLSEPAASARVVTNLADAAGSDSPRKVSPFTPKEILTLVASLERYSKHPLAGAILEAARVGQVSNLSHEKEEITLLDASAVSERPGEGLRGTIANRVIQVTNRKKLVAQHPELEKDLPDTAWGLECVILIDGHYAATFRFRDQPRAEGASFVNHLGPKHQFDRVLLVSGDRESEVRYLAEQVGIHEIYAGQAPEQKLAIVREETRRTKTVFLGDGINDAPGFDRRYRRHRLRAKQRHQRGGGRGGDHGELTE